LGKKHFWPCADEQQRLFMSVVDAETGPPARRSCYRQGDDVIGKAMIACFQAISAIKIIFTIVALLWAMYAFLPEYRGFFEKTGGELTPLTAKGRANCAKCYLSAIESPDTLFEIQACFSSVEYKLVWPCLPPSRRVRCLSRRRRLPAACPPPARRPSYACPVCLTTPPALSVFVAPQLPPSGTMNHSMCGPLKS
jgi:hypothetical protein